MTTPPPIAGTAYRQFAFFTLAGMLIFAPLFWQYFRPVGAFDIAGYPLGRDFINVWLGSRLAAQSVMTLFDYQAYYRVVLDTFGPDVPFHNWSYPPSLLTLVQPFGWLSYGAGLTVWTMLGLAVYLSVVLKPLAPSQRAFACGLLLLAPATMVTLLTGQNAFFTAALLLGGILLLEQRPAVAGILLGLLTVKPHLGLLLPVALVMIGAWRTIAAAAATAIVLVAASVAQWGIDPWIGFFTKTSAITRFYLVSFDGFYTYMMPCVYGAVRLFGAPIAWAIAAQVVAALAVVAVTAVAFRRTNDPRLRALLITSGTLLASPYTFNYDLTALTAAMLWVAAAAENLAARERNIFGVAWTVPVIVWPLNLTGIAVTPLFIAGVFVVTAMRILRSPAGQHRGAAANTAPAAMAPAY